jgi:hypothetical protein
MKMRTVALACVLVASAVAASSSGAGVVGREVSRENATDTSSPALVGRWLRVTTCRELVDALRKAGLGKTAPGILAGNGLVPGTPQQLAQKADICSGAIRRQHSHFFTRDGAFGSLDWNGKQVDDGRYRVIDRRTFRIGPAEFRYRISGKQLMLTPVITAAAKRQALARPLGFSPAGWQVAVSFPGHVWNRVSCQAREYGRPGRVVNQWC